jgi:hypothetical protein
LISNLHKEYMDGAAQVHSLMATTASGMGLLCLHIYMCIVCVLLLLMWIWMCGCGCVGSMTACVTLKCIAGAHLGQKFRLEAATVRLLSLSFLTLVYSNS